MHTCQGVHFSSVYSTTNNLDGQITTIVKGLTTHFRGTKFHYFRVGFFVNLLDHVSHAQWLT